MTILDFIVAPNRNIHAFGRPSSGKTSFFLYVAKHTPSAVVYLDSTQDVDPDQIRKTAPNIELAYTETSFRNVTSVIHDTKAKLCIVDDLTSFYLGKERVKRFVTEVGRLGCRLVLINQIREDIATGRPVAYFGDKVADNISSNVSFSRMERTPNGHIYRLHNQNNQMSIEVFIEDDGMLDEFFTMRRFILEWGLKHNAINRGIGLPISKLEEIYKENRDQILKEVLEIHGPQNPLERWI